MQNTAPADQADAVKQNRFVVHNEAEELITELAQKLSDCRPRRTGFAIATRLKQFTDFFQKSYEYFDESTKAQVSTSPAAEWLLDNLYVVEQAVRQIEEDLPTDYYQRLPKTQAGPARVYMVALANTQSMETRLDLEAIRSFLQTFQEITPLSTGELWAFPSMLRLAVLESLVEALAAITGRDQNFVSQPDVWEGIEAVPSREPVEARRSAPDPNVVVANSILSLRLLATQDWKAFFEATSILEKILRSDPAGLYAQMDFETRNRYRSIVEELANGSPLDEIDIGRQAIQLAQAASEEAETAASAAVITTRAAHIGNYLIGPDREKLEARIDFRPRFSQAVVRFIQKNATALYLGSVVTLTLIPWSLILIYVAQAGANLIQLFTTALFSLFPLSSIAIEIIHGFIVSIVPPRTLPKLDFQRGVPEEYRSMVVIPAMLATERDAPFLLQQIEHHFISNNDPNVFFALITDFADAPEKEMPGDQEPVAYTRAAIEQLNQKYGSGGYRPFYFFHRERTWNESEERWMGWERKRGKLEEFNNLLRGSDSTTFNVQVGDLSILKAIRYVITLDADTVLPREAARQLIGTLAHPLNQAEFDPVTGEIRAGHTILQPRVQVRPASSNQSTFTRVYSGDSIIDLYTRAVSDVYQDLFDEGNYVGKGIYDVDAFQKSLHDKIPENHLLSHDLFEGMQGRCGLVTDVVLFEDYPPHYLLYTNRLHRWVRGDWQLLPWLWNRVPHRANGKARNTLSVIDRWKLFDNLRRSLMPLVVITLLIAGWLFLPGSGLFWMLFALSPYLMPMVTNFIGELSHSFSRQHSTVVTRPLRLAALRSLFEIIFLPHEAVIVLDAITTTLVRLFITHRHMLQWVSAAHTVQLFGKRLHLKSAWQAMIIAPASAFLFLILLFRLNHPTLLFALPLLLAWMAAPYIATKISQPDRKPVRKIIPAQEHKLRLLARSTWLYFEHFVGPEDRWLPPDHFQEDPRGLVAHRTSPTNIGLMLLSTLSAHDMGYIGPLELSLRLRDSFSSMDTLERVRGHFLNWYDTRTFEPLPPRYISTVDSGNLVASLIALRQGCFEMAQTQVVNWEGFLDTLGMLSLSLEQAHLGKAADPLNATIDSLQDRVRRLNDPGQFSPALLKELFRAGRVELEAMLWEAIQKSEEEYAPEIANKLSIWINRVRHQLRRIRIDIQVLAPWLLALGNMPNPAGTDTNPELGAAWKALEENLSLRPRLGEIPELCKRAGNLIEEISSLLDPDDLGTAEWCDALAYDLEAARKNAVSLLDNFSALASRAETFIQSMPFGFLYDPQRHVFHIGYNVESGQLDANYYDLMASEARIASLIAIARGDVPQNHWLYLARPLTEFNGVRCLLSWSGTMFEYLMPSLFMESYPGTLIDQSCRVAIEQHIQYAAERELPWGTSEASYYNFDAVQVYQYRAFGIPSLGYKRGLTNDLVIAPYASILALPFMPQAVMQNLARLESLRMWGLYGLYESVDFTAERLKTGETHAVIRSFMAHHQGMILLSLNNYLFDKRMVRRFHADPRIESVDLLLQEQVPAHAPTEHPRHQQTDSVRDAYTVVPLDPWRVSPEAPYTQVHCLSNGNYSLLISAAGSGFSRWEDIELTRWHDDPTLNDRGSWIYVEDRQNGQLWSVTRQPTMTPPDRCEVNFYPHRVEFERQDGDLVLRTVVTVAANDDVEIRRVNITNHGNTSRLLALTSYAEIILSQQSVDRRHPAYNKLFIESEFIEKEQLLLFRRRPRSAEEEPIYLAHFFTGDREQIYLTGYETDREKFLGRGGTTRRPAVFSIANQASLLSNTSGATLDPICALQAEFELLPYQTVQVAFITLAAHSRKEAIDLARRYRRWSQLGRALQEIRLQAENELAQLDLTSQKIEQIQKLLSPLIYFSSAVRAEPDLRNANILGQSGLWSFSISGDYPILLARAKREEDLPFLSELLLAHTYWRKRGLMIDLVIFNQRATSYDQGFKSRIYRLMEQTGSEEWLNDRGGIFLLQEDQMNEAERILLMTVARVVLDGESGPLERQLSRLDVDPVRLPRFLPIERMVPALNTQPEIERPSDLLFDNGLGGFTQDGREYVIYLDRNQWTPAPWSNVIATPEFGCLVTEAGMGVTWSGNSGENRLTPWRNDPVSDPPSEAIYLRDEDTGEIWSPTPLPARADAPYLIRHGTGYSTFEHISHNLRQDVTIFVVPDEPVKVVQLKLHNTTNHMRRINVTYYAEWVLGVTRENTAAYIAPEFASNYFALLARNLYNTDFGQRVAFLASTREPTGVTTDRTEFLGELGSYIRPAALERVGLTPRVESGIDPCAVIQCLLWLQPGETKEITFLLGQGADHADAERLISHYQNIQNVQSARQALGKFWDDILEQTQVQTPDAGMDILLNRWLLYQSLSCRFWGRTAFYQSSGAYGFRDQLQDAMGYIHVRPDVTRAHILDAAAHQFEEGDVLHWWHPPAGRGLRTRCSDNLLWLPYVTAHYLRVTGDRSILAEKIPFLSAEPLKAEEHERYGEFPTGEVGTLYEHCTRAITKGITAGPHGIPLIGAHDWNDGMNRVGVHGRGESIWLGWFLSRTLVDFAEVCDLMDDSRRAGELRLKANELHKLLEKNGWDGEWYLRAYYDDGSPLGSFANHECRIDSIAQSWAVISENADPHNAVAAMESVYINLVHFKNELIMLFTPPFQRTARDPGYIKGYPPGIRENGGQYTHAAIWAIWAFAQLAQDERAMELFRLINPIYHADTPEKVDRYQVEPYVIAADVYSVAPYSGRGGWTWYTGSASWMYRLGTEMLLGLQRTGEQLQIKPHIPKDWNEYQINYRFGKTLYHIRVKRDQRNDSVIMDGNVLTDGIIPLVDDGQTHEVVVSLASK
ncbi:MAG TPA: glucoamylase family protein [Anaerolineales bacterium]|nr:glucoamylase family protein [Anaerolineales bacterium]